MTPGTARWALPASLALLAVLALLPLAIPAFWTANILGRAIVYGIVAMSLTFLATYGGFVSLAQMMIAGTAGYAVAILVPGAVPSILGGVPYALAIPTGLLAATAMGLLVGLISVRTQGIYLLMITLSLGVGVHLFVQANIAWFNGYEGIRNVVGPEILGLPFRDTFVFYYTALATAALLYALVLYLVRTPFGLALQALRDNPRRVSALGYDAPLHRIAAFGVAGFIAGAGGILVTFYNIGISPGTIGLGATVNILVMSVIGGLGHPVGAFIGAVIFTLFDTFAADLYDRDRFNTLVGVVFLAIVLASPDGVLGMARRLRDALAPRPQGRADGIATSRAASAGPPASGNGA
ncbi:branched-chain amino acid ABC transporter permease [Paracraurococcus ruber]|uniref:Branched-chain amino acid ABC transporter permease n=1 Tax=Paracraurococcus ruber TaxID=77675 RepID=A0ABS1CS37_9PROT|nr:branched-chain amino acid ABC transporter permease [Paracraurococcus ruber]MBK1657267.1 branched-chain amino acid ABC transporter permease [Paracraurococcus ruber]TDG33155.1 branched-chain amino acid ABC transporter permease [Paracraurococcus ruber]